MDTLTLQGIARAGGGLDMSAAGFSVLDLQGIARAGSMSGAKLVLRDLGKFTALDLQGIGRASPGNVVFVI